MEEIKDSKQEAKIKKKEEKRKRKEEKKAAKKPVDKMKIATRIIALIMVILMIFSVCGTLMFYLLQA